LPPTYQNHLKQYESNIILYRGWYISFCYYGVVYYRPKKAKIKNIMDQFFTSYVVLMIVLLADFVALFYFNSLTNARQ